MGMDCAFEQAPETGKARVFTHFPDLIPFQGHGSLAAVRAVCIPSNSFVTKFGHNFLSFLSLR